MALNINIEDILRNRMNALAQDAKTTIMKQVPQPGNEPENPYAKGPLRDLVNSTLQVQFKKTASGFAAVVSADISYGVYTNRGSGANEDLSYGTLGTASSRGLFGIPQFRGYNGPGTGGINPQWWLSLNNAEMNGKLKQFSRDVVNDIGKAIRKALTARKK